MPEPTVWTAERLDELLSSVERAVQSAVRLALIEHKRLGQSIVVVENNEIRWIPAEEIEIPDE
jgi:hypothetical protein